MERNRIRRVCRLLLGLAVIIEVIAWAAIAISFVAFGNGNLYASIALAVGLAVLLAANEFAEAVHRRM